MKFILESNNKTTQKISKKFLMSVFAQTLKLAQVECLKNQTLELSVASVGEDEMQKINNQYRKKDKPTDVLSFCEWENAKTVCEQVNPKKQLFIGELILCPKYIKKNADLDGESFEYALAYIVSHGILHLLGYDHGKKMFALQKLVADQLVL